ncbi:tape measure protein, partial [Oenococcus oeni]|uniref:tape measure protein n=1 Tax=Oenococcus oeni TaxID=1247 RepID=UPI000AA52116
MQAVWLTLTGSSGSATAMVNTINELSVKTGQATDTVNELEQGFYHLHSSKTESDELTKSMLNMADAVGLDSQQIQAVTQDMVNGLSRGTASNGMLNQISQYFPMFRENLAKYETQVNHGKEVTVADLKGMAMAGKISASDIENVFNHLGSGKYDKAADNMLQTMVGMERTIKARVPALIGDIEKPIMNAQNPIYAGISKWVSDPKVADELTRIGVSAEKGFNTITTAFAKAFDLKSVPNTMNDFLKRLSTGITD